MLAAALFLSAALAQGPSEEAITIAREAILLDGHVDMPYQVADHGADISTFSERMNFDYDKAMEGGLNAPFIAIYVAQKWPILCIADDCFNLAAWVLCRILRCA